MQYDLFVRYSTYIYKKSHDIEIKSKIVFSSIVAFLHDLEYTANDR